MDQNAKIPVTDDTPKPMDECLDKIASLVTQYGPKHLMRGMSALDANRAICACLERLVAKMTVLAAKIESTGVEILNVRSSVVKLRDERDHLSKEVERLANYLIVDWQDELGKGDRLNGESAVDVSIRLLKAYKEVRRVAC